MNSWVVENVVFPALMWSSEHFCEQKVCCTYSENESRNNQYLVPPNNWYHPTICLSKRLDQPHRRPRVVDHRAGFFASSPKGSVAILLNLFLSPECYVLSYGTDRSDTKALSSSVSKSSTEATVPRAGWYRPPDLANRIPRRLHGQSNVQRNGNQTRQRSPCSIRFRKPTAAERLMSQPTRQTLPSRWVT